MSDRYRYSFTDSGLFTLVNKEGASLYAQAIPLFERLLSHVIWILFWIALIWIRGHYFSYSVLDKFFMGIIFVHLFFIGCRLTTLMLQGGLRPILFPPLWVRLSRRLRKGAGMELLKKHQLAEHPGMLANLILSQVSRNEFVAARHTLQKALKHHPDHPVLSRMGEAIDRWHK